MCAQHTTWHMVYLKQISIPCPIQDEAWAFTLNH